MTPNSKNIHIEYSEAQIRAMPDSEKLNLLVEIGLANHRELCTQGVTLYGDDQGSGICEKIRVQALQVVALWLAFGSSMGVLSTVVIMHVVK
jgi:hypothetical protein